MSHYDPCATPATRPLDDYVQRWNKASKEQDKVFEDLCSRTLELEKQLKTLESDNRRLRTELDALRVDQAAANAKEKELISDIDVLRSEQESFKSENPLIACLLDGDGCIFSEEHLREGYQGGIQAAKALSEGLTRFLRTKPQRIPTGSRIITMLFLSKSGMESVLRRNSVCTPEEFNDFIAGFGTAHPLFSVVDVGMGKEAADFKMRDYLDVFVRLPQTFRVFFGGGHDNGYGPSLTALSTLGLQEKVVVLQSYTQLAREIALLKLPTLTIPGLFRQEKLERRPLLIPMHAYTDPTFPLSSPMASSFKKKKKGGKKRSALSVSSIDEILVSSPSMSGIVSTPQSNAPEVKLPCVAHHFGHRGCTNFNACHYDHTDDLDATQQEQLEDLARCTPCEFINQDRDCPLAVCYYGHRCPRGPNCEDHAIRACKFVGLEMHTSE